MSTVGEAIRRFAGGERLATAGPVQGVWHGVVLAESDRAFVIEGNHSFPQADVGHEHLEPSGRRSVCSWKGRASHHDVVVDAERTATRAAQRLAAAA